MHIKRLIILLFATLWLVPAKAWDTPVPCAELSDGTDLHRPQWKDIGMHDVLAGTGVSSLTPPNTSRLVHDTPTGYASSTTLRHAVYAAAPEVRAIVRPYVHRGYIYLLQCLRL
ncbi:MAG: hypothetical protein IJ634_02865 [Bacteroidales bacterium]|nr:hypothetical protein [Bacteroidales bacterium]